MPARGRTSRRGYGAEWQRLTRLVYETYGYVCHLCHQPIDPDLPRRHPMSKTVDHLDPIEHVGTALPTIDRVRPAHRSCNSSRGSRVTPARSTSRDW